MNLLSRFRSPLAARIDLSHPRVARDPWPHYEAIRRDGAVHYLPRHGFWIVLGYDEAKAVFDRPDLFSSAEYDDVDAVLLAADPPDHMPVRKAVSRLFSGDALARLADFARAEAGRLTTAPALDLVDDYAAPFTDAVAGMLLGFDEAGVADVRRALAEARAAGLAFAETLRLFEPLAPRASVYDELRDPAGGGFTDEQARSLVRLLWFAATTTTERAIVHGALRLLGDDALRVRLAGERDLLAPFAEEVVRLNPPESIILRVATRETELGGVVLPAGAAVRIALGAVNRDPAHFPDPAELRFDRPARAHLAFGRGLHTCPGAALARRLVPIALGALLDRPGLRPLGPLDRLEWIATLSTLVPRHIRVSL